MLLCNNLKEYLNDDPLHSSGGVHISSLKPVNWSGSSVKWRAWDLTRCGNDTNDVETVEKRK